MNSSKPSRNILRSSGVGRAPACWTAIVCSIACIAGAQPSAPGSDGPGPATGTGAAVRPPSPQAAVKSATPDVAEVLRSSVLNEERRIMIRLPRNYSSDVTTRYPVLFKLENEDGVTLYDNLIVVVIPNARGQRNRDMTPASLHQEYDPDGKMGTGEMGRGDRFLDFIEQELIPHIDRQYRTTTPRVLAGHSRSALLVLQSLLSKPDLFQARFIFSAPLMRDEQRLIADTRKFFAEHPAHRSLIYFNWGENENPGMNQSYLVMKQLLAERAPKGLRWVVERVRGANHQETPVMALPAAIAELFPAGPSAAHSSGNQTARAAGNAAPER